MYAIIHKDKVTAGILPWNNKYFVSVLRARHRITAKLPKKEPALSEFPWQIDEDTKIVSAQENRQANINPLIEYYYGPTWEFTDTGVIAQYEVKPIDLENCKANYKVKAATQRYQQEIAGAVVTIDNEEYKIETARSAKTKYFEKYVSMGDSVNWKFEGQWKQITKQQMYDIVAAIDTHVQAAFDEEQRLHQLIDECNDTDQLLLIEELNKPKIDLSANIRNRNLQNPEQDSA